MRTRPRPSLVQFIALLGGLLLCVMTSAAWAQTSLVPLSSFSGTQQSTTSTTFQNTDVVITAANLASGQQYLIFYAAAYGGSTTSELPVVAVSYGSTNIAIGADEGSSSGTPEAIRDASLTGFYILTGDGASDLRIRYHATSGTSYITGKALIAIPLATLTEGADYWYVEQNGDAAAVSTTSSAVNLLTTSFSLPETGNYLVLMSAEGWTPTGSTSDGEAFRAVVNTVTQKAAMAKEWENNSASRSFSYARIHSFTAGSNSFAVSVGSAQGTASKSFRRGRIVVVRASVFDQMVSTTNNSDFTNASNYPTFGNYLSRAYTPNQQEYVVVIGNAWCTQGQNFRSIVTRLQNQTDATTFSDFISDDAKNTSVDRPMLSVFGAEQISAAKTYVMQVSGEASYTTANHFQYGDLIVWSMTQSVTGPVPPVLAAIGAQSVPVGSNLNFDVTASDANGDAITLSAINLPANATFTDHNDGTGTFDFTPNGLQLGVHNVTFIAADTTGADSEVVAITVTEPTSQVGLISAWTTGLTHTTASGTNRMLVFTIGYEHGTTLPNGASSVTYGGQSMTKAVRGYVESTTGFTALSEIWYLNEAGISAASGNTFNVTWPSGTPTEPYYAAATYEGVDQSSPVVDTATAFIDGATPNPITAPLTIMQDGYSIATATCGNTGSYTWNNGWVEHADQQLASSNNSTADHADTSSGSTTVSATHSGPNRQSLAAVSLRPAPVPNQAPIWSTIGNQSVNEGQNLNVGVTATDLDGDSLILTAENLPSNATFTDNFDGTGTFDFTPDFTQAGVYNVRFIGTDGLLADTELVAVTVNDVNRAPVLASIGAQSVDEGQNLNVGVSGSDVDGDSLILSAENLPANATFTDNFNGTGTFDFNPDFTQASVYNVRFIVSDGALADTELVAVTVNNVNRVPVLVTIGAQAVDEGQNLNVGISATDADADSIILSAENLPTHATFTDNFDGTGTFDFLPDFTQAGVFNIRFIASDGVSADTELVAVTVNDANQAPTLTAIGAKAVDEGQNLNFGVSGSDPDGDSLIFTAENVPANATFTDNFNGTGTFDFTPDFTQAGVINVRFIVSDGSLADTELVAITVNQVNLTPTLATIGAQSVDEGQNLNVGVSASDPDGDSLILSAENLPANATFTDNFNGTGTFDFNPDFSQAGGFNVRFIVSDGVLADTELVAITVNDINRSPVLAAIGAQAVDENQNLNVGVSATDPDLDSLILSAENVPANATFTDNFDGTGTFDFNPDFTQAGVYNVRFIVSDGALADTELVAITVNDVNRAPVLAAIGAQAVDEGQNLNVGVSASDPDLDSLVLSAENLPANATFTDNFDGTGTFDFNPDFTQAGVINVRFIVSDGGLADTELVAITVGQVNIAPVLGAIGAQSIDEGQNLNVGITASDFDGDSLILSAENVPANATFTDNFDGTGTFDFNPDFTQASVYNVRFIVSDGALADTELVAVTVNDVGRAPVLAAIGAQAVDENQNLNVGISATDPDLDSLILTAENVPANATFTDNFNGTGTFDFNPDFTQVGVYNVRFIVSDGALTDTELVAITVNNVDRAPVLAAIGAQAVDEGQNLNVGVSASDPDLDSLILSAENLPANATFTDNFDGTGTFDFNPDFTQSGVINVRFIVSDGTLADTELVAITVNQVNVAPVLASIGSQSVNEGQNLNVGITASDFDGDSLILSAESVPANATFTDNFDGTGTFDFNPGFAQSGVYNVRFIVSDGAAADTELVAVTVNNVGLPPVLAAIGAQSVDEGQNLNVGVSATDPDPDSLILTAENIPANATFTDHFDGTGTFDFNPDFTQAGVFNVRFIVSDGALADTELVAITVNQVNLAPTLAAIGAQSVDEGQNLNVGVSATDPDADSLILAAENLPANATFTDNFDGTGTFDFNPDFTQSGLFNVRFIVTDGVLADTELVAVTVNEVDRAPVLAAIGAQNVDEAQNLNIGVSATDLDGDSLILSAENLPANATFTDHFDGTGTFDFNPDFTQAGVYNVRFIASDGVLADTELVAVTVNNVDRAPVLAAIGAQAVDEGQNLNVGVSASDPDLDSLILIAENVPANATFTDNFDGTGTFDFNPDFTQSGVVNVRFIVTDGTLADTELVAITVNQVNVAPVLGTIGAQAVDEGANLNFGITATDVDPDSLILTAENVPVNATFTDNFDGTGTFDFNPDFTQAGVFNVRFIVSDGALADTELVAITVSNVNRAPALVAIGAQATDENQNLNFGVSGSDPDGDSVVLIAENGPANATFTDHFDGTGTFDFTPDYSQSGLYNVRFIVTDGVLADTELVAITVNQVNLAPTLAAIGAQSVDEGQNLNVGVSASDPDLDSLILVAENLPANATFTDNFDGTGTFDFNPDFAQSGVLNVRFIVSDGALADTELVAITINEVDRAPVLAAIGAQSVDENQNLNVGVSATDPDGDSLVLSAENLPTNAAFTDNFDGTGTFDFNPDFTQAGLYNVRFIVTDGVIADTELVAVTVNNIDRAPVLAAIGAQAIDEGQNLNFGASGTDPDGDSLILSAENVPANATFTDNFDGTGTFDFNPDFTQAGVINVRFILSDGTLADTELVAITVNQVNIAPVLNAIGAQAVNEGQNLNVAIVSSDFDGDSLILSAENVPANATFTDNFDGTGTFDFNPDFTQSGVYNVRFIVSDGALADTELVAITVTNISLPPTLNAIGPQSVDEGQNLNFTIVGSDPDGDSLILTAESVPVNATFTDNFDSTGTFDFNPDFTQAGLYNVRFIVSDGGLADTELVAITVNNVNRTPTLAAIGAQAVDEGQNLNVGISASDPDGDSLILTAENVPANATFADNFDGTGTFDFSPDFTQAGLVNVRFIVSDGSLADTELVAITINDINQAPVLASIGSQSVSEGQNLNVGITASDFDGDSLILSAENIPANATFADNFDGTGTFDFNPDFTQSGVYNVRFIASDGILADTEVVVVTVDQVNLAPTLTAIGAQSVDEGQNLNVGVSASDFDLDSLVLSAENVPANATFTDNFDGTGTFDFNPDFTQAGVINVRFIVSDGTLADTELVAITVNQVNIAPVLNAIGAQAVNEGQNLNVGITSSDFDGDSLILSAENVPANATFTDNFDGTGTFDFNPDFTQSGVYNVRFIVYDGALADTELVAITVTNISLPPVLNAIGSQVVDEAQNLNFVVSGSDPDVDSLIFTAENVPANATFTDNYDGTGTFDFNPDYTQAGLYNVRFIVSDGGLADTELVAITVNNVNRTPTLGAIGAQALDEGQNLNLGVSGTDLDGDSLVLVAENVPVNATFTDNFDGTGVFDFNPDFTQASVYNLRFIVSDGSLADTELVAITVNDVNIAPVLAAIGGQSVDEGQNLNFGVSASDFDNDSLILSAENIPANATFTDNFDGTGTFDFNPDFTQSGVYNVRFIVSDGALADTEVVAISVGQVNLAPSLAAIGAQAVDEGQNLNVGVSASDPDADSLILSAENLPANATFTDNFDGTGTFDFNPDFTQASVYNVRFIVSDGVLADTELVAITVTNINQAPVLATIGSQSVNEGQNLNFGVSGSDFDGDSLILVAQSVPLNATFTDHFDGTGTFDFNPDFTQSGTYNVRFIVSDGALADTELVQITVNQVSLPPILTAIGSKSVNEGQNLNFGITAIDPDNDSLILTAPNAPANATLTDNGDGTGTFNFNPDYTQDGIYIVRFIASDGALADTELVQITVHNVNRAPTLAAIGAQVVDEAQNLNLALSAVDLDGDSVFFTAEGVPTNATFTDHFNSTATFDFNPDFTQAGVYNVRFIVSDGALADSELVQITVNDAPRTPVLAAIGAQSVDEGQNLNFGVSASDPDLDSLILTAENVPANATFTDNFDGTGSFDFNPDFNQAGLFNVRFIVSDGALADTELVAITVSDVNRVPVLAVVGAQSVTEGQILNVPISGSDPDGDSVILSAVGVPTNATFTDNFDGTGTFDFNPSFVQAGSYPVTFIASDGILADSELVTITVNEAGNQFPVLDPIGNRTVAEGDTLIFRVHATDPENAPLSLLTTVLPSNAVFVDSGNGAGSFRFTPSYTQAGTYFVTFLVEDPPGDQDNELVKITVTEAGNQAPVLDPQGPRSVAEGGHLEFRIHATDPDATIPTLSATNLPANATFVDSLNGAGSFAFDPTFGQAGVYTVYFIASDTALADTIPVEITVGDVNLAPSLAAIGAQSVDEGQNLNVGVSASDPDLDSLILTAENLPSNATFTDNFDGTGTFDFNPDFTQASVYNVRFIVSDGALADTELVAVTVTDVNRAPALATIGAQAVDEGANLNVGVSGSDPDGDSLNLTAENLPANATFTDNFDGTGTFDFNPDFTQAGLLNVRFIVSDGALADTELVAITVNDVNRSPVLAAIGAQAVNEGANLNFGVSGTDPDGDSLILTALNVPANATFTDNFDGTGTFDFNPDFAQTGNYQVTFIVSDGVLADSELVVITVGDVNRAPVLAAIGAQSVDENQNLNVGVSATDPDADSLILSAEGIPANATFTDNFDGTGTFDFNPDYFQAGVFNVRFIVTDGGLADTELVAITVNNVDRAPVLAAIGAQAVDEGQNLNVGISASDPDLDSLVLTAENVPANATFTDNFDGTGTFDFNPDYTQSGLYNVRFIVTDGEIADTELVAITVNHVNLAPVLASIGTQLVDEGQNLNVGISASDFDGDSLVLSAENLPANATFTDNFDGTGTFDFNPDFLQSGTYNVLFIVSDGVLADSESVQVIVNDAGNQRPVLASIGAQSVTEGQNLNVGIAATDSDLDSLILSAVGLPSNATFTDNFNGTGTFDFNPNFVQAGVYNVTFIASDGGLADSEVVAITVNDAGNQSPVFDTTGPQLVTEGQNLNFGVSATDPDLDSLILSTESLPTNATFTDNFDGTGTLDFNPDFTQAGLYNIRFIVSDGSLNDTLLVAVTVNSAGNQKPALTAIPNQAVDEGQNLNFGVTASDLDLDSLILTAESVPANATFTDNFDGTGTFDFNPDFFQSGVYNVRFIVSDGALADTQFAQITVNDINRAPVLAAIGAQALDEGQNLNLPISASDLDLDSLILTAENVPANATFTDNFDGTGTLDFSPDFTQAGLFNVRFIVSDGVLADTELVAITVNDVNLAPVLNAIGSQSVDEGQNLNVGVSASDFDNDSLVLSAENIPANATFTDNFDGTGTFDFNPDYFQSGLYNVTFIVSDGALADTEVVAITVNEVDRAPVLAAIGPQAVNEGANLNFGVSAFDLDGDSLILTAENVPANATFTDNFDGTGTFDFNPDFAQTGNYPVRFIVSDGVLADTELVLITVGDVNRPPVLNAIGAQAVDENQNLNVGVSASDPDADSLILTAENLPANATFTDNFDGSGTFDFNPTFDQAGLYNVRFIVSDGVLADTELVAVTVNDVNRAPVLAAIGAQAVAEGQNLNVPISASDPDLDSLILTAENVPANATFTDNFDGTGTFVFNPDFTQSGLFSVRFIVTDGVLADTELVSITVGDVNRAPVLAAIGAQSVDEGQNLNVPVSATDPDSDSLTLVAENLPANATFTDNFDGTGTLDFNPDYTQSGVYNVRFITSDGVLADTELVVITVNHVNLAPVLNAIGTQVVNEGQNLNFGVSSSDFDNDSLVLSAENIPANATFTDHFNGTGTFDFNPDFLQSGTYNVRFIVSDGALADTELVQVIVNDAGNQRPVLATIGAKSVTEGQNLSFLLSATDADLDSLIFTANSVPLNATFTDNFDGTAIFSFDPSYVQSGPYIVTFIVSDGGLADSEVVPISVFEAGNQRPIFDAISSQIVDEGQNLNFGVTATDPDLDSLILSAKNLPLNATFTDHFDGTGTINFNPNFTQAGVYLITVIASDGLLADSDLVQITVNEAGNQAPVWSAILDQSVNEGGNLNFVVTANDPESDSIILSVSGLPANATFTDHFDGSGTFDFSPDYTQSGVYNLIFIASDGVRADSELVAITVNHVNLAPVLTTIGSQSVAEGQNLSVPVTASDFDLDSLILTAENLPSNATFTDNFDGTGTFDFNPDFFQAGLYNVRFIVSDGALADTELVAITVTEVDRTPVLNAIGSQSVAEGQNLNVGISGSDPDGDSLILTAESLPANATFTDNFDGTGTFDFNPDFSQASLYNVRFIISDGTLADTELVAITVTQVNLAPTLAAIGAQSVDEGQNLNVGVSGSDPDGDSLILSAENLPANATFTDHFDGTGTFDFNPDFTQEGVYNLRFIVSDGALADTELVAVTVNHVNLAPVLNAIGSKNVAEGQNLNFGVTSSDFDNDSLVLVAESVPTNATFTDHFDGTGTFDFNPDFAQGGVYNVRFIVSDGALADTELVVITVGQVNLAPSIAAIGAQSVDEGQNLNFNTVGTDPDGDSLIWTAENVPANATFADNFDNTGTFDFNPDFTQSGVYNVRFIVSDGALADTELVAITVNDVNLPPVVISIGAQSVDEGQNLNVVVTGSDPDADSLIWSAENLPANATFNDNFNGTGTFDFNPDFTQAGLFTVRFIVSDGALADTELVQITVNDVNRVPTLASIGAQSVNEGLNLNFGVSATDPDGDSLILSAENTPLNGSFIDNGDGTGTFDFSPDFTQSGVYAVRFIASDGALADTENVTITVNEANAPPVLDPISPQSVAEGAHVEFRIFASDVDGTIPTLSAFGVPLNATFADSGNGAGGFAFDPSYVQAGVYNVGFVASDGSLDDTIIVAVTVTGSNATPVADAGPDQGPLPLGTLVQLDGSASTDADLDSLTYHWLKLSGPTATLSDSNAAMPTFTATVGGTAVFRLIVNDGTVNSVPDTVSITLVSKPSTVADLNADVVGAAVQLTWSPVTTDTSGAATMIARYVIHRGTRAYFTPSSADSIGTAIPGLEIFNDNNLGGIDVVGDTGTNYFYCIEAIDAAGVRSDYSNRVGEYDFQIFTTSTTDFSFITMPFEATGVANASDLIQAIGTSNVNTVSRYIATSQSYESRFAAGFGTNFTIVPGGVYQVNAKAPTVFSIAGRVPAPGSVSYSIVTTSTTDFSFISIPFEYELDYTVAQDVINALPGALNTLSRFIPASQSYESRFAAGFGTNFPVRPGRAYQANAAAPATFPVP